MIFTQDKIMCVGLDKFSCSATTKKSRRCTTCKFPFLHNGQWTFGCVNGDPKWSKRSKGESWCPTQLDTKRRFIKGSNLWGVCDEKCPKDTEGDILVKDLEKYKFTFRVLPSEQYCPVPEKDHESKYEKHEEIPTYMCPQPLQESVQKLTSQANIMFQAL
jgi:hypothetical protein